MKQNWTLDELIDTWTLSSSETAFVHRYKTAANRVGVALLLKYFQLAGRFPYRRRDIPQAAVEFLTRQMKEPASRFTEYSWRSRSIKRHRVEIRRYLGFRQGTVADAATMSDWLCQHILPTESRLDSIIATVYERYRHEKIEPATAGRVARLVRSAQRHYSEQFCDSVAAQLSAETRSALDTLLTRKPDKDGNVAGYSTFARLKRDAGKVSLKSILAEVAKLESIQQLNLPVDLFKPIPLHVIQQYAERVSAERPSEVLRHSKPIRYTLLAAFCYLRGRAIADNLIELFNGIIKRIDRNAEKTMARRLFKEIKHVRGKGKLLFTIAKASIEHPDKAVSQAIYPVADETTLQRVIEEYESDSAYEVELRQTARQSYARHYRQMVPSLLKALQFHSDHAALQPLIQAVKLIQSLVDTRHKYYPDIDAVPITDVVPASWQTTVVQRGKNGDDRINRISYELCVFQQLREQLRCRAVWIDDANHYRNPDHDLPIDFNDRKTEYYQALQQPQEAQSFVDQLRQQMVDGLTQLNDGLTKNPWLTLDSERKHPLRLTPLPKQDDPLNLAQLKQVLQQQWPMTPLLEMLKEADMRVDFTTKFQTSGSREQMSPEILRKRLLLCLYALGTNTGYKRMGHEATSDALRHIRRRYITKQNLRAAIAEVVNATFEARAPHIWGEATTACASDSKKFAAWDQNLLTEWHVRYRGPGIMVYWHVDKKAACIHSQVKRCSSSEVAAMIEGVLHHCTKMSVDKNYVDTHGQSSVAFAFCHLLGFELMPRLKPMNRQKLNKPYKTDDEFNNLKPILTRPIDWELIAKHYDDMVRYATALRLGTAEAEAILQRFTKHGVLHPTYKALIELGKAKKTVFLCQYLNSLETRREIHEGLNVVENWNSANSFIFFARSSEIQTNDREAQEISVLALHLLQVSMVYINTLMIQRVLQEPEWESRMQPEDLRALTPLIYEHVNPYGSFELDLNTRIAID